MTKDVRALKERIIEAGYVAVEELVRVAEESIIKPIQVPIDGEEIPLELSADRLKNAAATKKLAIFDAFEILSRIEAEKENLFELDSKVGSKAAKTSSKKGFAERNSR